MAKKIKLGALTNREKFRIQEMYLDGVDGQIIADKLFRGLSIVTNYIDVFKQKINGIVSQLEEEKKIKENEIKNEKKEKLIKAIENAKKKLKKDSNLSDEQIDLRLTHIMSKPKYPKSEDAIYNMVMNYKPFIESIGTLTKGNHAGRVAIFTEAAAEIADYNRNKTKSSRLTKGNCFPTKKE